jgi:vitamin B12 transporter
MAWRPHADWIIRAVASTGFRAPSLYELYSFYGNTALTPETSRSFELGAEYLLPNGSVQMTLFHTAIDDKIGFVRAYEQIPGTTTTRGVEFSGSVDISDVWSIFGNYTYADAVSANAGAKSRLVRVPRHDLTLGVAADFANGLGGVFTVQRVTDFLDSGPFPAGVSPMPDYTVANLSLSYDVTDKAEAYLRVENIFDRKYETIRNYAQPGRSVYVGLQAKF